MQRILRVHVLLAGVALAGCGTTVSLPSGTEGLAAPTTDGLAAPAHGSTSTDPSLSSGESFSGQPERGSASAAVPGSAARRGPDRAGGSATTADQPSRRGAPVLEHGPGVEAKAVTAGVLYTKNSDQYQRALGNTATTSIDVEEAAKAVAADINNSGGVAGRRLELVFHADDTNDTSSSDVRAQAACSTFTEDNDVLIGLSTDADRTNIQTLLPCMQKAGSAVVQASLSGLHSEDFSRYPLHYDTQMLPTDRVMLNLVDALVLSDYFTGWDTTAGQPGAAPVKVGILGPDKPQWLSAIQRVLVPELARRGFAVAPENVVIWNFPRSSAQNGQSVAQIQSTVLKFKANGVTHVLPVEQNSSFFFTPTAESQRYRPRYGINSNSAFQVFVGTSIPHEQARGALGVGWVPNLDLPTGMNPADGPYSGPGRAHCTKVLTQAGLTFDSSVAMMIGMLVCDELYSLQQGINRIPAGTPITAPALLRSIEGLGSSFRIAGLPQALFGPGHRYPVTRGWTLQYDDDCRCTKYDGAHRRMR